MRVLLSIFCIILTACVPGPKREQASVSPAQPMRQTLSSYDTPAPRPSMPAGAEADLPRAAPAYVQWLERQSMLGTAPQLTGLVSGTERLLSAPSVASVDRIDTLLAAADAWLWLHPPTLLTAQMRPVWVEAAASAAVMEGLGLRGIYIAPTQESGSIWGNDRRRSDTGEDITSLGDAPHMGSAAEYQAFAAVAAQRQWQVGTDVVRFATGMGPDFFLGAQMVRDYGGTYIMVDAPESVWPKLPKATEAWEGLALDAAQTALLVDAGAIPPALARDGMGRSTHGAGVAGGWAVTGPVRGHDGRIRRFVYRYDSDPRRPVLAWDDPSGAAKRILSASVIHEVGLRQHTLAGVHIAALIGLDAAKAPPERGGTLEPAPSALRDVGREVRRYGGWSVQRDILPAGIAVDGTDFSADTITNPAAEYAIMTGNAGPLRAALAASVAAKIDQRRLARGLSDPEGIALGELADAPLRERLQKTGWGTLLHTGRLYATAPTVAAIGAGLTPETAARHSTAVLRRHILLTLWRAGLPGLLFISGQDITGALALGEGSAHMRSRGAYGLSTAAAHSISTRQGTARAPVAYAPVEEQLRLPTSYVGQLRAALALRRQLGLGRGTVHSVARTTHPSSAGLIIKAPHGTILLIANFGESALSENIPLGGSNLRVDLAPLECKWLRLP